MHPEWGREIRGSVLNDPRVIEQIWITRVILILYSVNESIEDRQFNDALVNPIDLSSMYIDQLIDSVR